MVKFTVFTPTYNRAHTLHRVYQSLASQTWTDFEWLVIDDGSTDHTQSLIKSWQKEAGFTIRYLKQENQGKHIAFNRAVIDAQGEFFVPLDSDDACVSNALERFYLLWSEINAIEQEKFSGICVNCQDQHGKIVGNFFPKNKMDSNSCEMVYRYRLKGEKWGFHKTAVLKQYPFPNVLNAHFVPESIVWHAIAKQYKIRFVNESLRIYYQNETMNVSLTHHLGTLSSLRARLEFYIWVLNNDMEWFWTNPFAFLKAAFQCVRYSKILKKNYYSNLKTMSSKFIVLFMLLPATILAKIEGYYVK